MAPASTTRSILTSLGALSDGKRLRILHVLERQELEVADLCDVLQLPQSTVSRHLKVLLDQGWVRSRGLRTSHLYRLSLDDLETAARRIWVVAREETQGAAWARDDRSRLEALMADRNAKAEAFFAGAAAEWEKTRQALYGERFAVEAIFALLPAEQVVADLGFGTGSVMARLAPHVKKVIGVDSSPAMFEAAAARLEGVGNVELRRGDLQRLPIDDEECDAAMMLLALTYVRDPRLALSEMARALRPGGRAAVVDLLPHERDDFRREMGQASGGFSAEQMKEMMGAAGFAGVRCVPMAAEAGSRGPALFLASGTRASARN